MKKVFLLFFLVFFVGSLNAESVKNDLADQDSVSGEMNNNENSRGWGYYYDLAFDADFLKISDSNEGVSSSAYGTRSKDTLSMGMQFYGAVGPTYNFTENFGIGAKIGFGIQYFMLGYSGLVYDCSSSSVYSCGYTERTTFIPINFGVVVPIALDLKYSFNKKIGLIGGAEYDIGSTMSHFRLYVGGIFYKNAVLKVGYSHTGLSDSTLKKALNPSSGSKLNELLGVGGVDLGGGTGSGFYISLSYMVW